VKLGTLLHPGSAIMLEEPGSWPGVARELARRAVAGMPDVDIGEDQLTERLTAATVPVEGGVAFPHVRVEGLARTVLGAAFARGGVEVSGERVELLFLLAGPPNAGWEHLGLLARLARICHRPGLLARLRDAVDSEEFLARLRAEDASG